VAIAVMAGCLVAVQLQAWQLEQRYVRSLTGAITPWPAKSRGLVIERLALEPTRSPARLWIIRADHRRASRR
jgi:hypothetical protein